jgi:hypothetical protein
MPAGGGFDADQRPPAAFFLHPLRLAHHLLHVAW